MASPERRAEDWRWIMSGPETNATATTWSVFSAMCPRKHPPLFAPLRLPDDGAVEDVAA